MRLPPLAFRLHDNHLEMRFVARDMFSRRSVAHAPSPKGYEEYGAQVVLEEVTADSVAEAARALYLCAARTFDALERDVFDGPADTELVCIIVPGASLPVIRRP